MDYYQLTEQVNSYLNGSIEDGTPYVLTPEGCSHTIVLDKELTELISRAAERVPLRGFRLTKGVGIEFEKGVLVLKRPWRRDRQCLIRVETSAGVGGKVRLEDDAYDKELRNGSVAWNFRAFPPPGVQPLCSDEVLKKVNEGTKQLDVLLIMNPGASFRITRTGQLEGASPRFTVRWNGALLKMERPKFYEERAERGASDAVAG